MADSAEKIDIVALAEQLKREAKALRAEADATLSELDGTKAGKPRASVGRRFDALDVTISKLRRAAA